MGMIQHHSVIATTWNKVERDRISKWIAELGLERFFLISGKTAVNEFYTVVLVPDGSKEGWEESDEGDARRDLFVAAMKEADYEDGSNPWKWVEVEYGELGQQIVRSDLGEADDETADPC